MKTTNYTHLLRKLSEKNVFSPSPTRLEKFPKEIHPKDYDLVGCYLLGKSMLNSSVTWSFFEEITLLNISNDILDATAYVNGKKYSLVFRKKNK